MRLLQEELASVFRSHLPNQFLDSMNGDHWGFLLEPWLEVIRTGLDPSEFMT
jgi:hypothetical protein